MGQRSQHFTEPPQATVVSEHAFRTPHMSDRAVAAYAASVAQETPREAYDAVVNKVARAAIEGRRSLH